MDGRPIGRGPPFDGSPGDPGPSVKTNSFFVFPSTSTSTQSGPICLIVAPLYLAIEGGVQSETLAFYDEHGEELAAQETEYAPWARVALETWITTQ